MAFTEPMVPVEAEPLEDGETPAPEFTVDWAQITDDLTAAFKGNRNLALMYAGMFQATVDKHTALSYPCKKCGQQQFFRLPLQDTKTRFQAMEAVLNRVVGKPADTVRLTATIDDSRHPTQMTDEEIAAELADLTGG